MITDVISPALFASTEATHPADHQVRAQSPDNAIALDGKYPALVDSILADAGIGVVLAGVRMPRMNSVTEPAALVRLHVRRHDRLGGLLHEYDHAADQHG